METIGTDIIVSMTQFQLKRGRNPEEKEKLITTIQKKEDKREERKRV